MSQGMARLPPNISRGTGFVAAAIIVALALLEVQRPCTLGVSSSG